ncbi:MAG: hypothetical protein Q4C04_01970 [Clostridia bacterium]|nr:hypothetical protein [Clostridia bacterium]
MKRLISLCLAFALALSFSAVAFAGTNDENKQSLLSNLKSMLNDEEGLDIYNQVEKIINREEITVSDEQLSAVLAIDYSTELANVAYKGIVWGEYTDAEQASALRVANEVGDILGLTFTIDPSNDSQLEGYISVSVYKDGKLMGVIDGDAKTDVANATTVWYLVGGGVLLALAIAIAVIVFRKRDVEA